MNKKYLILYHIIFWIGWVILFNYIINFSIVGRVYSLQGYSVEFNLDNINDALPLIIFGILFKASFTYFILLYLFPKLLIKKKVVFFVLSVLIIITIFSLEYVFDYFFIVHSEKKYDRFYLDFWNNYNIIQYVFLITIMLTYIIVNKLIISDKKLLIANTEKLQSELTFLKYQINPHLLFNTLNNLFSMSQKAGSDEVSEGISKLSDLMRYMLYDNKEEEISLNREVEFIKNFIELQKLRNTDENNIVVNFQEIGDMNKIKIKPFILIPFIENAFKHGIDLRKKSVINIILKVESHTLNFKVTNSIFRNYKGLIKQEGGIGLNILEKRLVSLYPENHQLKTEEINGVFYATLIINFQE